VGLLKEILLLPMAPVRLAGWTVEQVVDTAEREYYDPARIRSELAELSNDLDEGRISAEEFDQREDELLDRLSAAQQQQEFGQPTEDT